MTKKAISTAAQAKAAAAISSPADEAPVVATRVRYEGLPVVVIAGRPNVGKSTLYNRLLHKRRAITDPTPGVTRDLVESVCELRESGKAFKLVDTGGFKLEREGLDDLVVAKSLSSLEKADLILFLVDATQVTPEDEEFARLLRTWSDKVLLVVNKVDSSERDALAYEHAAWGFEPISLISAEHGRNILELEKLIVSRLDFSAVAKVDEERAPIRLAIMGKPNTGKSTLLNRLVGEEKSIVSDIAGTTRDIVEARFERKGRQFVVLDTAGIRRKGKVTENVEYYSVTRSIKVVQDCDVVVLMIDAQEGLTDQDKKIAAFAVEEGRGVIFALNKWDLMPDVKNAFEASRDKLRYFFGQMAYAPVLQLSAKEGEGIDKLVTTIISVHAQLTKKIETSALNKAVEAWVEATPPPVGPTTRFKLRYAVQTSSNPQKFAVFVSRPDAMGEAYVAFLRNKIRSDLGMDKVPVILEVKASHAPRIQKAPMTRAEHIKQAAREEQAKSKEAAARRAAKEAAIAEHKAEAAARRAAKKGLPAPDTRLARPAPESSRAKRAPESARGKSATAAARKASGAKPASRASGPAKKKAAPGGAGRRAAAARSTARKAAGRAEGKASGGKKGR